METYRSGHNGTDSKSVVPLEISCTFGYRGFESHRLRHLRRTKKISPRKARFDRAFRRFFGKNFLTVSKDVKSPKTAKSGFELTQNTVKQNFRSRNEKSAPYFYQETSIVLNQVFRTVGVFFYFAGGESNLENDKSQDQKSDKALRSDKCYNI